MPKLTGFARGVVLRVAYAMLGLTGSVVLVTIALSIFYRRKPPFSDYLVGLAFVLYVTMCALNIAATPYMHNAYEIANGDMPLYPGWARDLVFMIKLILASFCMFWSVLWLIKFSLLFLYRRLLKGIAKRYTIIWWGIVVVCLVTHAGNYVLFFQSCSTIPGFWTGKCTGKRPKHAQLLSLYYSFIVDTTTNLMIMALPIHLTWNLQMPRSRKVGIHLLFASGLICILFACLRVVEVAKHAAKPEEAEQPIEPTWMAVWGMIECAIAVIIGCCPALAGLAKDFSRKSTNNSHTLNMHIKSHCETFRGGDHELMNTRRSRPRERHLKFGAGDSESHWADAHSSQEELKPDHDGIMVSTTVTHEQTAIDRYEEK